MISGEKLEEHSKSDIVYITKMSQIQTRHLLQTFIDHEKPQIKPLTFFLQRSPLHALYSFPSVLKTCRSLLQRSIEIELSTNWARFSQLF